MYTFSDITTKEDEWNAAYGKMKVDCFSVSGNLFCFGKSNYAANYHSLMVIEEEPSLQRNSKKNINFTLNLKEKIEIVEVSKPQELVVFSLETGIIGVIQLKSLIPNLLPEKNESEDQQCHYTFPDFEDNCNVLSFAAGCQKSGYNLQLHETFLDKTITAINICTSKKCFYVGTSEGIVSCFKYEDGDVDKILELDSSIVQISLSPNEIDGETKVLVSTETRTIICDTVLQSFIEIGSVKRQGKYGGVLTKTHSNDINEKEHDADDLLVYCTRPGSCIWRAAVQNGEITQVLNYKEQIAESFVSGRQSSLTELHTQEGQIDFDEFKSNSRKKSISHSFSLIFNQQINCFDGKKSSDILMSNNAFGLYFIALEDLSVINYVRLDKKVGSILQIKLDPHLFNAVETISQETGKTMKITADGKNNDTSPDLEKEELKAFPVYILDSFSGFVQRVVIQPRRISSPKHLSSTVQENQIPNHSSLKEYTQQLHVSSTTEHIRKNEMKSRETHDILDGIIDLPIDSIGSNFATVSNEIDYLNLSVASQYISSKIKTETKNLIKKTSAQVRNTAPFKEGMKFLDEFRIDISPYDEKEEMAQTSNDKQSEETAYVDSIYSSNYADFHNNSDMVDGEMGPMQTFLSPQDSETLSVATTFITDIVTNEARKIVSFTGDQIKKTSKFQESMKLFNDLCEEGENNEELKDLKLETLKVARMMLDQQKASDLEFDSSELLNQFNYGLLSLKQHASFCERNLSSSEVTVFSKAIGIAIRNEIFVKAFLINHTSDKEFVQENNDVRPLSNSYLSVVQKIHLHLKELSLDGNPSIENTEDNNVFQTHQFNEGEIQQTQSKEPICPIHEILRQEQEKRMYDEKLSLFITFCSDLFVPESLFSQLKLDYSVWKELIRLFINCNEKQILLTSLEFMDESNSSDQTCFNKNNQQSWRSCRMRMLFLSRAQLKIEEYQKTLQTASLVSSSTTNKTFKRTRQKKLLEQLLEIITTFIDSIYPEDIFYVAIYMYEQIFTQLKNSEVCWNTARVPSKTTYGDDNHYINNPDPEQMNETSKNVLDLIQQFFLFSFSLILKRTSGKNKELNAKEWLTANQSAFEINKECFAYYYPLYQTNRNSKASHLSDVEAHSIKSKQDTEWMIISDTQRIKDLDNLGFALLSIRMHPVERQLIEDMEDNCRFQVLTDCTSFCKTTQFWAGYFQVLKNCPLEVLWRELDVICSIGNSTLLGDLGFLSSKKNCLKVLHHIQRKGDMGCSPALSIEEVAYEIITRLGVEKSREVLWERKQVFPHGTFSNRFYNHFIQKLLMSKVKNNTTQN